MLISNWLDSAYKTFFTDAGMMRTGIHRSKSGDLDWWEEFIYTSMYGIRSLYNYISQENVRTFWEAVNSHPELSYWKK